MTPATTPEPICSHRKVLVRRTERLVPLFVLAVPAAAQSLRMGLITAAQVESKLLLVFLVFLWGFTVWFGLCIEFATLVRGLRYEVRADTTLWWRELAELHRWCPPWIKVGAHAAGVGLGVYVMAFIGPLGWPALASATRMPGSYADHFAAVRAARGQA